MTELISNDPGGSRPTVAAGQHPIESTRYIISTPQVAEMCSQAVHWIRLRVPGAIVYAPPRHGKSRGLEILRSELIEAFPGMPIVLLPAWDYTAPREKPFLSDLLTASGHALNRSGTAEEMRERLVNLLGEEGTQNGQGRVLLIIDEGQNLHPKHYNWLTGIHNLLILQEVNLIVLLVGQQELLAQRRAFVKAEKKQIVGRFMIHDLEFHGVRSVTDLREILQVYDDHTEYPAGSGWSFTRYYAAQPFHCGWRLARLSEEFWNAFRAVHDAFPEAASHREVPMQYFCRTVEHFLIHLSGLNLNDETAVRRLLTEAIGSSGYFETFIVP